MQKMNNLECAMLCLFTFNLIEGGPVNPNLLKAMDELLIFNDLPGVDNIMYDEDGAPTNGRQEVYDEYNKTIIGLGDDSYGMEEAERLLSIALCEYSVEEFKESILKLFLPA